jgi:hypothetical protein
MYTITVHLARGAGGAAFALPVIDMSKTSRTTSEINERVVLCITASISLLDQVKYERI